MLSTHDVFIALVTVHITTGACGLIAFWVPVAGRKGGKNHRRFGRWFVNALLFPWIVHRWIYGGLRRTP